MDENKEFMNDETITENDTTKAAAATADAVTEAAGEAKETVEETAAATTEAAQEITESTEQTTAAVENAVSDAPEQKKPMLQKQ